MPAQQGFEAADAAGVELDQRLEINFELLPLQRLAQVDFQGAAGAHGVVHGGIEQLVGAAALGLDEIERDVGAAQQVVQVVTAIGGHGDADAGGDAQMVAVDFVNLAELVDDEAGQRGGVAALGAAEADHGEFVAAEAHHHVVGADAGGQAGGHIAQQGVAHRVAAGVVDLFEAVQVDQQHQRGFAVALGVHHAPGHDFGEVAAVVQAGQRVAQRLFTEALAQQEVGQEEPRGHQGADHQGQHDGQHDAAQAVEIGQRQLGGEGAADHDGQAGRRAEAHQAVHAGGAVAELAAGCGGGLHQHRVVGRNALAEGRGRRGGARDDFAAGA